jgi:hypothetical protein
MTTFTFTGAALKDERGDDFIVISLPPKYIPTDKERQQWQEYFRRSFEFPVVIVYWEGKRDWILVGPARLVRLLGGQDLNKLPWQRVLVESELRPPISYDPPKSSEELS